MSNNDKFIRDTPFGKLMEGEKNVLACKKCKFNIDNNCKLDNDGFDCLDNNNYYFAKDEPEVKMENSDRLVEETEFGKLMETSRNQVACHKCKYENHNKCRIITKHLCEPNDYYYFLKENTENE